MPQDDYDDQEDRPRRRRDEDDNRDDDDRPRRRRESREAIPNYLVQSILVTLFCCMPFGIAAIVFAAQVGSKEGQGDYEGALESSRKAKQFCWIAFGCGLAINILVIGFYAVAIAFAVNEAKNNPNKFGPMNNPPQQQVKFGN